MDCEKLLVSAELKEYLDESREVGFEVLSAGRKDLESELDTVAEEDG